MFEPSARADTVTPPSASPVADLMVPESTASACAVIGVSAVADSAAASSAPVPVNVVVLVLLMASLLICRWCVVLWLAMENEISSLLGCYLAAAGAAGGTVLR